MIKTHDSSSLKVARSFCLVFLVIGFIVHPIKTLATTFTLKNTIFEQAGHEFNVDPSLLYAIAIVESAVDAEKGRLKPSPWTLRTNKPYYFENRTDAEKELINQLKKRKSIDVGMMQINTKWHKHRVKNITDLLDPLTNVRIGAQIISENISRYPRDAVMAIGAYHSSKPEKAKWYANHVIRVYSNIKEAENVRF